uniref:Uncharacterized protein n=1 Tax=Arundo donax TaxID=35708 RepID=A0A0A8ZHN0_ARUDO
MPAPLSWTADESTTAQSARKATVEDEHRRYWRGTRPRGGSVSRRAGVGGGCSPGRRCAH